MRLTSALVERTLSQFEAEAIPDNHPVIPQLRGLFGDHTFFLDVGSLHTRPRPPHQRAPQRPPTEGGN